MFGKHRPVPLATPSRRCLRQRSVFRKRARNSGLFDFFCERVPNRESQGPRKLHRHLCCPAVPRAAFPAYTLNLARKSRVSRPSRLSRIGSQNSAKTARARSVLRAGHPGKTIPVFRRHRAAEEARRAGPTLRRRLVLPARSGMDCSVYQFLRSSACPARQR